MLIRFSFPDLDDDQTEAYFGDRQFDLSEDLCHWIADWMRDEITFARDKAQLRMDDVRMAWRIERLFRQIGNCDKYGL